MDIQFDRRRETVESPPAGPGEPRLVELLRGDIERHGPITFARFMQRALYEPGLGYYAASVERPTRAGDFLTAPEMHPIFGRTIAGQLEEMWQRLSQPERFELIEYGAGSGALVLAVLEGLAETGSGLLSALRYRPQDLPAQAALIGQRLADAGHGQLLEPSATGPGAVGCVLANEFIDALPLHLVVRQDGRLRELFVDWRDGRFTEVAGEPSTPALERWFVDAAVELAEGQRAEVNLAMLDWLAEVGRLLERGYVLVIDYGAESAALYGQGRRRGTLRAFRGQHVSSDALGGVGQQDLTANVDLGALERGAAAAGLELLGRTSQAEFLAGAGLEKVLAREQARAGEDWPAQLSLRSAVARLLDPRALGGYAVVLLGQAVPVQPPLSGLGYTTPSRH